MTGSVITKPRRYNHFGSSLNSHLHFHFANCDGVFYEAGGELHLAEASITETDISQMQEQFRKRILRLFVRRGVLDKEAAQSMAQWSHGGGFSINGAVRIGAHDRLPKPGPYGEAQLIPAP